MPTDELSNGEAVTLGLAPGGIATLTLNRPRSLNAMSHEAMLALDRHLDTLANTPQLRVVVITGAGRAFSAGGDLLEFEQALQRGGDQLLALLAYNQTVLQRVEDLPVPVIGAINGIAIAGGLELLLCCDLLIAADTARLGDGHARYGIVPAGGATVRLMERLHPSHAARLFYTATAIDAQTAADWGLVNEVVPASDLQARTEQVAKEIASCSPEAIGHIKTLLKPQVRADGRAARIRQEIESFAQHLGGTDLKAGLASFRRKSDPSFKQAAFSGS